MIRFITLAFLFTVSAHASIQESWYLSRAESNMKIKNYKAAIEAYEKVVAANPKNREATKNLGLAYENQGLKDKAIETYDRYLERWPDDAEVNFKQGDNLSWSRYSYRRSDALKFYRQGLQSKDDSRARLRYAQVLSQSKSDVPEAIVQYERVLQRNSRNAEAHAGLAKAYAWNGDNDRSLYHSNLAAEYGAKGSVSSLQAKLEKGREPGVAAHTELEFQPSGLERRNFRTYLLAHEDIGPFVTAIQKVGLDMNWNDAVTRSGLLVEAGANYRVTPSAEISGILGYADATKPRGTVTGHAGYLYKENSYSLGTGFLRRRVEDSNLSSVGSTVDGVNYYGNAVENAVYGEWQWRPDPLRFSVRPRVGWISSGSLSSNFTASANASADWQLVNEPGAQFSVNYAVWLAHFSKDYSSTSLTFEEPLPGGYFSPRFFFEQLPTAQLTLTPSERTELRFGAGPALQYTRNTTGDSTFRVGTCVSAAGEYRFSRHFALSAQAQFRQIADVFNQFQMGSALSYLF